MAGIFQGLVGSYSSRVYDEFGPESSLMDISNKMKELKYRHMPIIENNEFVGIVTDRDLKLIAGMQRLDELSSKDIMRKDLYIVDGKTSLSEVLGVMIQKKLESTLVKENGGLYIFTTTDAMKVLKSIMD